MTPELFAHYARKEGLIIARQQVIDWGGGGAERVINSDCLSLVVKSE